MEGVVIVIWPERPFKVAVVVPDAVPELRTSPLPAADDTKFPAVAVIFPRVAVNVVVAAIDPGAINAEGTLTVIVDPEAAVVISEAVPAILILPTAGAAVPVSPVKEESSIEPPPSPTQLGRVTLADVEKDVRV
jgi:hypothetical protein